MSEYYLISQLPSLDGISDSLPMPITEERFLELCDRFLGEKAKSKIKNLTLLPPLTLKKSGSTLIDAWNEGERNLRLALAKVRAEKMKKSFDVGNIFLSGELIKLANTVVEINSPLKAQIFLSNYRLEFLETLRPIDNFSEEFVYYYGLKLKLTLKMRAFDVNKGQSVYKNIYNSILNGESLEVK